MRYTYLWLMQLITGILIAVLLGIHMVILHLDAVLVFFGLNLNDPTSWHAMIERSREVMWAGIYIAPLTGCVTLYLS
jgi:hypothetical protein